MKNIATRPVLACAVLGMVTGAGCAGARAPYQARAEATGAIQAAQAVGASEHPEAALHLELANEQLATANRRIEQGEVSEAERLLRQAEADAAVAISLAREADTRASAEATLMHIEQMRARHL